MKRIFFLMSVLLTGLLSANATDEVVVTNVTIPQGGTGTVNIELNNDQEFTAFQMQLTLPEGVNFVVNKKGNPTFEKGDRYDDHSISSSALGVFTCASFSMSAIDGTEGLLLSVNVTADETLAVGTQLTATLSNVEFTTSDVERVQFPNVTFNITIGENASMVEALEAPRGVLDNIYDLNGKLVGKHIKLSSLPKGVYVVDGKKVANY